MNQAVVVGVSWRYWKKSSEAEEVIGAPEGVINDLAKKVSRCSVAQFVSIDLKNGRND